MSTDDRSRAETNIKNRGPIEVLERRSFSATATVLAEGDTKQSGPRRVSALRTKAFLGFAGVVLAGCGTTNYCKLTSALAIMSLPDQQIVPGERVGPIKLWSTIDSAKAILGKPDFEGRHTTCWGQDCSHFAKYGWYRYGITAFTSESDPRAKISQINVYCSVCWNTVANRKGSVNPLTPFNLAIDKINESLDIRYRTRCDDDGCAAYDADGMWIRADKRDGPLTEIVIYDAAWDWNNGYRLPMGNFPPPNGQALTQ